MGDDRTDNKIETLEVRIRKLEELYLKIKASTDLLDPKNLIEFQAATVSALKAIDKELGQQRQATNRRITWTIASAAVLISLLNFIATRLAG